MRWLRVALATLVILLMAAAGGLWLWLAATLPKTEGEIAALAIAAPVEIVRDRHGIPVIRAESEADAYFALGFVHAQDRMWQMDLTRRIGAGRVAEVIGEAGLRFDRLMRTLGLYRLAQTNFAELDRPTQQALVAYAAGVNAYIADHGGPLPPEFTILDYEPEPWVPADSLVWGKLMAMRLSAGWRQEALRGRFAGRFGEEALAVLFPAPVERADLMRGASNAWALAPGRSTTGSALLANDPHLGLDLPGPWYLVRIEVPGLVLAGATAPGVPFHVLGHNGHMAWGMTSSQADVEDLFVERVDPEDATRYLAPGGSRPFQREETEIGVRGARAEQLVIRRTRHGPVISPVDEAAGALAGEDEVVALAAPWLVETDRTADAIYHMNRARDRPSLEAALATFEAVQQHILFAFADGAIGLIAPGRVPVRADGTGALPSPGWTGEGDWTGFIPYGELPRIADPEDGAVVNANDRPVGPDYPYWLGAGWDPPFRAARIAEALAAAPRHAPADAAALMADRVSLSARLLLPAMAAATEAGHSRAGRALALLARWDGEMDPDRPEPLIFEAWIRAAVRAVFADELGDLFDLWAGRNVVPLSLVLEGAPQWCDDIRTPGQETCATVLAHSLETAIGALAERYGEDMTAWRWGEAHRVVLAHRVFDRIPVVREFVGADFPYGGGDDTVDRAAGFGGDGTSFPVRLGASLRAIYDLGNLDASLYAIPGGQSGNPMSPHFLDLAGPWSRHEYLTIPGIAAEDGNKLTLVPVRGRSAGQETEG